MREHQSHARARHEHAGVQVASIPPRLAVARDERPEPSAAGVGGGAGTGVGLATKGQDVSLAAGTQVRVTLQEPVAVRVPISPQK